MIDASSSSTNYETILQHILSQPYSTNFFITLHPSFSSSIRFMSNTFITTYEQQFHHNILSQNISTNYDTVLHHNILSQNVSTNYDTVLHHNFITKLHHNLWNNLWTILSQQFHHNISYFITIMSDRSFNTNISTMHHDSLS